MEDKKIIYKCITFALASIMLIILFITTSGKIEEKKETNTLNQNNLSQESKESFNTLTNSLNSNYINSLNITYDKYGNPYYQIEQYEDFAD